MIGSPCVIAQNAPRLSRHLIGDSPLQHPTEETLYQRLGGYDAIAAATDELLSRLQSDPQLGDYWKGASNDNQRKARQLIVDFMVEAAGGPAMYTGRDMKKSHDGMHISGSDWDVFMRHSEATLDHFGVGTREKDDVLAFFASLRSDIVVN
jgi:hemoglobin